MAQELHQEIADVAHLSACAGVDDLFAPPARRVIARLTANFLASQNITVTEFLHRAEMLERFENTGKLLQFAVQQVAVVRAASEDRPVHELVRSLFGLADDLVTRVRADKRKGLFPSLGPDGFEALAAKFAGAPNRRYVLDGALAQFLRDARSWNEKTVRLIGVFEAAHPDTEPGRFLAQTVDAIVAEVLSVPAAIEDFVGPKPCFGDGLITLLHVFHGVAQIGQYGEDQALDRLANLFAVRALPMSRAVLAAHILEEIGGQDRLRTDSVENELRMLRTLTELALECADDVLGNHDLVAALQKRSMPFVSHDCVKGSISRKDWPEDKLSWLLSANRCITGTENKRSLAEMAIHICSSGRFKNHFLSPNLPLSKRLHKLAQLNADALASDFPQRERAELAHALDAMAIEAASCAKLFESVDARRTNPAEKATALLQLFAAGTFTEGRLSRKARQTILRYLARPGFLDAACADCRSDGETAKTVWVERLEKIGIPAEASRKAMSVAA